jgi:hypothetical protein
LALVMVIRFVTQVAVKTVSCPNRLVVECCIRPIRGIVAKRAFAPIVVGGLIIQVAIGAI